eukprot:1194786-Prorocentrum_minimum.AAC.1
MVLRRIVSLDVLGNKIWSITETQYKGVTSVTSRDSPGGRGWSVPRLPKAARRFGCPRACRSCATGTAAPSPRSLETRPPRTRSTAPSSRRSPTCRI